MHVKIKLMGSGDKSTLPAYKTPGAAGMDLVAAVTEDIVIPPGQMRLIPCGFAIELPDGMEAQVRPRSGLALTRMVTVLNSPGTIDSDYRGEVQVMLINHNRAKDFVVKRGTRIAQMVIAHVSTRSPVLVDELSGTERGEGGFGSTGTS